jgi:hypothetical protein
VIYSLPCEPYRTSREVAVNTPKTITIFMTMIMKTVIKLPMIMMIMKLTTVMVMRRGYDEKEKRKMTTTTVMI